MITRYLSEDARAQVKMAFRAYQDPTGWIINLPNQAAGSCGNGWVYTAECMAWMTLMGCVDELDEWKVQRACSECMRPAGNPWRNPPGVGFSQDQEGPDDFVGLGALSPMTWLCVASLTLAYGRAHRAPVPTLAALGASELRSKGRPWLARLVEAAGWVLRKKSLPYNFNTHAPDEVNRSSWMGRQPQLIAHLEWAADRTPPLWRRIWWAVVVGWIAPRAKPEDSDAWRLTWLLILTMRGRSWLGNLAAKRWGLALRKAHPEGMKGVYRQYFGPEHPLAQFSDRGDLKWLDLSMT